MHEELSKWWKKDRFNIILTVGVGLLPFIIELGAAILNVSVDNFKVSDTYFKITIKSPANYLVQTIFIAVTLYVLISNRQKAYKDLSESKCQIKQYIARNGNIKIYGNDTLDQCYRVVNGTVKQFYIAWLIVWFLWLVYYLGNFLLKAYCSPMNAPIFSQTFDFLNSSAIFVIYLILTNVTVDMKKRLKNDNSFWYGLLAWVCVFTVWLALVCTAQTGHIDQEQIYHLASILLSIFSAISFVLVLGKINSNYLQIPRLFLFGLYTYSIIQAYIPFIEYEKFTCVRSFLDPAIAYITIVGKVFLMLTLCWIVNQKRLIFFVIHKSISIDEAPKWLNDLNKDTVSF